MASAPAKDGKMDVYKSDSGELLEEVTDRRSAVVVVAVTTSAQAEGVIEGVYTDYELKTPFSTLFKFSRFNSARDPHSSRQVFVLRGTAGSSGEEKDAVQMGIVEKVA
eukprot:4358132-Prymnesium_polylepis.1